MLRIGEIQYYDAAYQDLYPEIRDLDKAMVQAVIRAVDYHQQWIKGGYRQGHSKTWLHDLYADATVREFVVFAVELLPPKGTRRIRNATHAGVIAALYQSWMEDVKEAHHFWTEVFGHSRHAGKWILDTREGIRTWRTHLGTDTMHHRCIRIWDLWMENHRKYVVPMMNRQPKVD
jgi:hypothetical protein